MPSKDREIHTSVVIPVWNEEKENIEELYLRLTKALFLQNQSYEIVFVDDGSSPETIKKLKSLHQRDKRVKLVRLKENFGQSAAFLAGFKYAHGKVIVTMDADLQYAPEDAPKLINKVNEGYDIVIGKRVNRYGSLLTRRIPAYLINNFITKKVGIKFDYGCSFNAFKKDLVKKLFDYGKRARFLKLLFPELTDSFFEITVNHYPRKRGCSKYNFFRLFQVGLDILLNFSLGFSKNNKALFIIEEVIE